ncbi:BEL1-like homeodomain protein 1 [Vigna unguiculata]|uniref:Pre-B-cell leukemia transcription factor n=1 Tax=Vigna unguiculata TaxID=3917 RepID=A0A4D6MUJ9_VIGUN|nr:BEL1-like homeodomain protein 1 [Vigna unguiculata]XP_027935956.1 BEL1-like homeodomain protein 1 [Vigna unguiculata]QCE05160.1 pre-B-cell leukemia transcription factor [Vigna unguiculata]
MATYFQSNPKIQAGADGLQTLVLMNPDYVQYSDAPPPPHGGNHLFLNSAATVANNTSLLNLPHAPSPHTQQFVGVPLSAAAQEPPPSMPHDVSALHGFLPRMQYNLWNTIDPNTAAREAPRASQGLSLSLHGEEVRPSSSSASGASNGGGVAGIQSVLLSSKYLRATQELLDEVVNVNSGIKVEQGKKSFEKTKVVGESSTAASGDGGEGSGKRSSELSTTERQEIQMKKAKLINMLDEVEQRYRQYHNQMQIVTSSFEQVAGIGSARTYTALALQTISKQFRCLKDAITGQIRAANKSLGEEDCFGAKVEGSRLKYVDHHLRQQRAIQQLGMIHHNAWRPQRGLPERSVSVLRAWLFEHFLHPYPKDSDKHMLAKQTGLTRSQVSNWFINARVRLWKPMVEEMYLEEMKEHEVNGNGSEEKSSKSGEDPAMKGEKRPTSEIESKGSSSKQENNSTVSTSPSTSPPVVGSVKNQSGFSFMGSSELDGITQGSPKKARNHEILVSPNRASSTNNEQQVSMDERQSRDGYSFMGSQTNFTSGFGQYPMEEIGRFDAEQFTPRFSGNGVSLTLGLPHCDTLSGTHQNFLPNQNIQLGRGLDIGQPNQFGVLNNSTSHSSAAFESMNMQNPKRFAAQLVLDFVA